jgi:hypothetical protein
LWRQRFDHLQIDAHVFQIGKALVILRHARGAGGVLLLVKRPGFRSREAYQRYRHEVEMRLHETRRLRYGDVRMNVDRNRRGTDRAARLAVLPRGRGAETIPDFAHG